MALIAVANRSNGVRWTDGQCTETARSLGDLLRELNEPSAVVCEPEFYDYLSSIRRPLEDWLREGGHQLIPITPSIKEILEAAGAPDIHGRGVERLFALATIGSDRLDRISRGRNPLEIRGAVAVAHLVDLYGEPRGAVEAALAALGPYASLDAPVRDALGDGRRYCLEVLVAAYRAASASGNRNAFEQVLGLNAGAHGPLTRTIRAWYEERNTNGSFIPDSVLSWSDYRRALRQVFHAVAERRRSQRAA